MKKEHWAYIKEKYKIRNEWRPMLAEVSCSSLFVAEPGFVGGYHRGNYVNVFVLLNKNESQMKEIIHHTKDTEILFI